MDGSNLVFIVVPIVIPLILAIGIALPFVAAGDGLFPQPLPGRPVGSGPVA